MNRREFMRTAGGATAVASATTAAAASPSVAQEGDNETDAPSGNETGTPSDNESDGGNETDAGGEGGGGGTEEVVVGPGGDLVFEPESLTIEPGTTVVWEWDSDGHNVVPDSIPDEAGWEGHEPLEDGGFTYEHTFEVDGSYEYVCTPHEQAGMIGTIEVGGDAGEGGAVEKEPEEMGVPIQAHFVGISTILAIVISLIFTFFQLKYGESPHASGGNR